MEINDENLIPLLDAANNLGCEKAIGVISDYIFKKSNLKNYLFYYKVTKLYHLKKLNNFFCNILLQRYLSKKDVNIFYKLNLKDFCKILSCTELQMSSELELFNAAVDWINYKPKQRKKHMSTLLKFIRLPLLSDKILTDVIKKHKFCKHCINCSYTIDKAIKNKTNCADKSSNTQFQNRYYMCQFERNQIIKVGGADYNHNVKQDSSYYRIEGYNFIKPRTISKMQQQRYNCKTAVIATKVYCFGGTDSNRKYIDTCEVYCRKTDSWSSIVPLSCSVSTCYSVCAFMGKIYLFGDLWDRNWVYDPTRNDWNKITTCIEKRHYTSCTVFRGQCLVIGGRSGNNYVKELRSVEKYDHYLEKWSFLANMQVARYKAKVVATIEFIQSFQMFSSVVL